MSGRHALIANVYTPRVFEILKQKHQGTIIAVIGASNNTRKYGSIITRNLLGHGYTIWPVNPRRDTVHGLTCYPTVAALPGAPAIVNVVTPPEATLDILRQCAEAGVANVWLQPGSFDDACLGYAASAPFSTESEACIMVVAARY